LRSRSTKAHLIKRDDYLRARCWNGFSEKMGRIQSELSAFWGPRCWFIAWSVMALRCEDVERYRPGASRRARRSLFSRKIHRYSFLCTWADSCGENADGRWLISSRSPHRGTRYSFIFISSAFSTYLFKTILPELRSVVISCR